MSMTAENMLYHVDTDIQSLEDDNEHFLSPQTEQEEQDYLALKVMQEIEDEIVELEVEWSQLQVEFEKKSIEYEAAQALIQNGEIDLTDAQELLERRAQMEFAMQDLRRKVRIKEKVLEQIKESIKTERYKIVNPVAMRNIHFF